MFLWGLKTHKTSLEYQHRFKATVASDPGLDAFTGEAERTNRVPLHREKTNSLISQQWNVSTLPYIKTWSSTEMHLCDRKISQDYKKERKIFQFLHLPNLKNIFNLKHPKYKVPICIFYKRISLKNTIKLDFKKLSCKLKSVWVTHLRPHKVVCSDWSATCSVLRAGRTAWSGCSLSSEFLMYLTDWESPSGGRFSWTLSVCVGTGVEVIQLDTLTSDASKVLSRHCECLVEGGSSSPESGGASLV